MPERVRRGQHCLRVLLQRRTIKASKKAGTTADLSFEYRAQSVYVNTSYKLDITDEATNSLTLKYFNPLDPNATPVPPWKPSAPTPVLKRVPTRLRGAWT